MALPTNFEQYMLELVNKARLDPLAEAARLGIDLNKDLPPGTLNGTPRDPLAMNVLLIDAARGHSQWMIDFDVFDHDGNGGSTPTERMTAAGYTLSGSWSTGENISWRGTTGTVDPETYVAAQHDGLFRSAGHRTNILADGFVEIGIGQILGVFTSPNSMGVLTNWNASMVTQNFARTSSTSNILTGVVYTDIDADNFYSPGEGRGGVSMTIGGGASGATIATGGFGLAGVSGSVSVQFSGGGLAAPVSLTIAAGGGNVKLDLVGAGHVRASADVTLGTNAVSLEMLGAAVSGTGNGLANTITGTGLANSIAGGDGADTMTGGAGNDTIDGGTGSDTAIFSSARTSYLVQALPDGQGTRIVAASGTDGTDTVRNVEFLRFGGVDHVLAGAMQNRQSNVVGSRYDDVVFHNASTGQSYVTAINAGAAASSSPITGLNGSAWQAVDTGDMNADGFADVVYQRSSDGAVAFGLMSAAGVSAYHYITGGLSSQWRAVGVGDLDGDVHLDLVVQNTISGDVYMADMAGTVSGGWRGVSAQGAPWQVLALGDIDGNGTADLVYQHSNGDIVAGLMSTAGTLTSYRSVANAAGWVVKGAADIDRDGDADVVVQRSANGDISYARMSGATFQGWGTVMNGFGTAWQLGGMVDTNNDGDVDAVIRNALGSGDTYVVNMESGAFQSFTLVAQGIGSQWYVV